MDYWGDGTRRRTRLSTWPWPDFGPCWSTTESTWRSSGANGGSTSDTLNARWKELRREGGARSTDLFARIAYMIRTPPRRKDHPLNMCRYVHMLGRVICEPSSSACGDLVGEQGQRFATRHGDDPVRYTTQVTIRALGQGSWAGWFEDSARLAI